MRGGVACIVLNRPEVRDALSRTLVDELGVALAAFEADREVLETIPQMRTPVIARSATTQDMEYGKTLRYLREQLVLVGLSDDAKEGIAAFFEKRAPQWKGR